MTALRQLKHRLLRHFPGQFGAKYARKHAINQTEKVFLSALENTRNMVAIDLGANVGKVTYELARHASHVYAFEPDPLTCQILRETTQDLGNVTVIEAAAGDRVGKIRLFRHLNFAEDPYRHSVSSSTCSGKSNVDDKAAVEVDCIDILDFLQTLDGEVGILKMDIEGAEVDILERLFDRPDLMAKIRYIFAELHEDSLPELRSRNMRLRVRAQEQSGTFVGLDWR